MKKTGILHGELSGIVARLCPGETLALTGVAVPLPPDVPVVDLAVTYDVPRLIDVLDAVLSEMRAERVQVAETADPALIVLLQNRLAVARVPTSDQRAATGIARAVVRTGEPDAGSTVILSCAAPV